VTNRARVDFAIAENAPIYVQPTNARDVEQIHERADFGGEGLDQEASAKAHQQLRARNLQHHLIGSVNPSEINPLQVDHIQSNKLENEAN
jgi:hypothetical protein